MSEFDDYLPAVVSRVRHRPNTAPDPAPGADGKHPPGTLLSNFAEATRLYGKPVSAFSHDRWHPYGTGH